MNREPITDSITRLSPTSSVPLARNTARRAESPVPVGERSSFPGSITTALRITGSPVRGSDSIGLASWQNETWRQSGWSGWSNPSCSVAARVIVVPTEASSRASAGTRSKPNAAASTMTKLSPP